MLRPLTSQQPFLTPILRVSGPLDQIVRFLEDLSQHARSEAPCVRKVHVAPANDSPRFDVSARFQAEGKYIVFTVAQ